MAKYLLRLGDREVEAELEETPAGYRVKIDGVWRQADLKRLGNSPRFALSINNKIVDVLVEEQAQAFKVRLPRQSFEIGSGRRARLGAREGGDQFSNGQWTLLAPLTGVIAEVRVTPGQLVEEGETLIVMEAMKMLNDLQSKVAGTVASTPVKLQEGVEIGSPLVVVTENAEAFDPPEKA